MARAHHLENVSNRNTPEREEVRNERRELVWSLKAQGLKPYAIYRFIRDNENLHHLIEGYHNPYKVIETDLKKPPAWRKKPHEVEAETAWLAVEEVSERLDEQYQTLWRALKKLEAAGSINDTYLKLHEQVTAIAMQKAKILGVTPDGAKVQDQTPGGQTNIFVGSPGDFLRQVAQAGEALKYLPGRDDRTYDTTARHVQSESADDSDSA